MSERKTFTDCARLSKKLREIEKACSGTESGSRETSQGSGSRDAKRL